MRRGSIARIVAVGIAVGIGVAIIAIVVPWLPAQASEERERIDFVFWFTTVICIAIFALVCSVIIYSVFKFRVRPDDDTDGPPIHGHTGLEIAWTAIPAVLVAAISIVSAVALARNDSAGANPMRVEVLAQQFAWSFTYPDENNLKTTELRLPLNRSVELELHSNDVIHSFWVPEFGQKQDAVPGIEPRLVITPTKLGTYPIVCTELCGLGHPVMRSQVVVMRPGAFRAWVRREQQAAAAPGARLGEQVFAREGCGGCHTFGPAGSRGETGPPLNNLAADARERGREPAEFVRESIVEPDAFISPGFQRGGMPDNFDQLPKEELDALVQYLLRPGSQGTE